MTFTKERIIEELKASTQNASGMFEISEDTICSLMALLESRADAEPVARDAIRYRFLRDKDAFGEDNAPGLASWDDLAELDTGDFDSAVDARIKASDVPLYTRPQPAPVVPEAYVRDERGRMMLNGVCEPRIGFGFGWNACRAAMLQGKAEPVSQPLAFFDGDISSRTRRIMDRLREMNSRPGCHQQIISEPVSQPYTLREWIPCSERIPDDDDFVYIWPRPDFGTELHVGQYCKFHKKGAGWYAQVNEQNYGIEWYPITVTHWMPIPNPPKE